MKTFLHYFFILLLFLFIFSGSTFAQTTPDSATRYGTCDLCGYCNGATPPSSWPSCRSCLYPGASANATDNDTLRIDPATNVAVTPIPGKYFTMIGCIPPGNSPGFTEEGAGGAVVQVLLNLLFSVSGGIAFLYLIYGAFLILTSQADPEKLNHGKRVVMGAIIGVVFILGAVFIVNFIGSTVLKIPGFGDVTPTPDTLGQ